MKVQPDENWEGFFSQAFHVLTKTIFPALVAVSVGLAVKMQQQKITPFRAVTSFISGCGVSYIIGFYVHENYSQGVATMIIAGGAIMSERVISFLLYKAEFDELGHILFNWAKKWLKKMLG